MEGRPPAIAKRLWDIVRIAFFMLRKGISKRKFMFDLHLMLKQGKLAGKAIGNLMFHHTSSFSCRPHDAHLAFVTPREYEFSCSNTPANNFPFHMTKRKHHHHHYHHHNHHYFSCIFPPVADEDETFSAVQKALEMLNSEFSGKDASPLSVAAFGLTPMVSPMPRLRITDSPFPLKNPDEDNHVDKEAEEYIARFYEQLKLQKKMAVAEARYQEMLARSIA